jgi:acyl carrier protein
VPTCSLSPATLMTMPRENTSILTREAVAQQIMDLINQDEQLFDLTAESSLQSHGLDSLKIVSVVFKIEDHYDINLDDEAADDLRTVGDLADLVLRCIQEQS